MRVFKGIRGLEGGSLRTSKVAYPLLMYREDTQEGNHDANTRGRYMLATTSRDMPHRFFLPGLGVRFHHHVL